MYLLLIYFLILVVPVAVMPRYIKSGSASPYRIVLYGTIGTAAAIVIVFMAASMSGQGIFAQISGMIETMAAELAKNPMVAETLGMASASQAERTKMLTQLYDNVFAVMPACLMILGLVVSYVEYIIISRIMTRRFQVKRMPKFREFSWPGSAFMGVMGMYLISWVLTATGVFADNMVYMNMDMLFNFVFSIQGVSVVLMFCHMKRVPKAAGVVIAVVMWMIYVGRMALLIIGMFDLILGLKRRIKGR